MSLAWFPAADYRVALERWPSVAEHWADVPHDEYCRRIEQQLRAGATEVPGPWSVAPIHIDEYVAWCEAEDRDPEESRAHWAAQLLGTSGAIPWPPGRNDPCWCRSGRKYKRCCGGFPSSLSSDSSWADAREMVHEAVGAGEESERRRFAAPPASGVVEGIDLALLDPADPDERRLLIEAEHPELRRALRHGDDEVVIGGQPMNPHLHITMHEIVANQLWDDDPPAVWQTAKRLLAAGFERHEVLHMLCSVVATRVWATLGAGVLADPGDYAAALEELPESYFALAE